MKKIGDINRDHEKFIVGTDNLTVEEAKSLLESRTKYLSERHGLSFSKLVCKSMRTRWGSCNSHHKIVLNVKLAKLSREFIDYIILHELVHTEIPNHKKQFWDKLETIFPGAKKIDRAIRKYHLAGDWGL